MANMFLVFEWVNNEVRYKEAVKEPPVFDGELPPIATTLVTGKTDPELLKLAERFNIDIEKIDFDE